MSISAREKASPSDLDDASLHTFAIRLRKGPLDRRYNVARAYPCGIYQFVGLA